MTRSNGCVIRRPPYDSPAVCRHPGRKREEIEKQGRPVEKCRERAGRRYGWGLGGIGDERNGKVHDEHASENDLE